MPNAEVVLEPKAEGALGAPNADGVEGAPKADAVGLAKAPKAEPPNADGLAGV